MLCGAKIKPHTSGTTQHPPFTCTPTPTHTHPHARARGAHLRVDALRLDQEGFSRLLQANNNLANKVYRVFLHQLCERLRETSDLAARAGGLSGGAKTEPLIPAQILFEKG